MTNYGASPENMIQINLCNLLEKTDDIRNCLMEVQHQYNIQSLIGICVIVGMVGAIMYCTYRWG